MGNGRGVGVGRRGWDQECVPVGATVAEDITLFKRKYESAMEESPLHPFELHNWIPISLGGLDISINKAVVIMWVVVSLVAVLMVMAGSARKLVPGKLQSLAEMMVDFIRGIIMDTMGKEGMRFFPLIATLFLFILFCNLIGLIPGSYTVTSQIVVTAVFACLVYGLSLVMGFLLHGAKFLGILVPPGTPAWLLPLMIPIELISQLARPISLAVRLFANMTAGHVILGVLFGLAISGGLLIGWLPFAFTIAMNGLEVGIAFIQAYIFTVLTCVYLGDAFHLHGHDEHAH
ncbi:MAG: synthase subunit a [Nitrospirota bacterium]|jgi:F-type H+-transporting ATPase subunit a